MKVTRLLAVLTLAVAALVALPASPASAAIPGLHDLDVAAATGAPVRQLAGNVQCPAGEALLSIGASNATLTGVGHSVTGGRVARAVGAPLHPSPTNHLFIQATCAPFAQVPPGTATATATAPASSSTLRTATARCLPGEVAYGGGGYLVANQPTNPPSVGGIRMVGSIATADGTGWKVTVHTSVPTDRLVVRALCARLPGSIQAPAAVHLRGASQIASGYQSCPSGMQPLSGGAYIENQVGGDSATGRLDHTLRVPNTFRNGWFGAGNNLSLNDRLLVRVRCI
ncbi:hypothetical protein [Cryptosporangium aurantiacum]|uniref:Uncharacterized protein n=1 Tax=Cryptosporangium aurantiacum TaxID=134849 RepID=A0A1M7PSY3_9ACTN|nr:hypothetical protein [Cryptosporangium aurantiacum]SHN20594.1 hypothetical protein SAMN05443668_103654 [Cryptosporangium aurantiacum]